MHSQLHTFESEKLRTRYVLIVKFVTIIRVTIESLISAALIHIINIVNLLIVKAEQK